jgi:hypothetical protein
MRRVVFSEADHFVFLFLSLTRKASTEEQGTSVALMLVLAPCGLMLALLTIPKQSPVFSCFTKTILCTTSTASFSDVVIAPGEHPASNTADRMGTK